MSLLKGCEEKLKTIGSHEDEETKDLRLLVHSDFRHYVAPNATNKNKSFYTTLKPAHATSQGWLGAAFSQASEEIRS